VFIHVCWGIASIEREKRKGAGLFRYVFPTSWYTTRRRRRKNEEPEGKNEENIEIVERVLLFSHQPARAQRSACVNSILSSCLSLFFSAYCEYCSLVLYFKTHVSLNDKDRLVR
jgi:hypothetical protein